MSEWWTYSLSDFLLFSPRTYYRLFELYNIAIWPAHTVALALGVVTLVWLRAARAAQRKCVAAILAGCWLWIAFVFHWRYYATINWAAAYFAGAFALEAILLAWIGIIRDGLVFDPSPSVRNRIGAGVVLCALALQPLLGPLFGRPWTQAELFGMAPDPTVVATLGFLLATGGPRSWMLWVVPVLWCALSGAVTWTMGSPDALVMPLAALVALIAGAALRARQR